MLAVVCTFLQIHKDMPLFQIAATRLDVSGTPGAWAVRDAWNRFLASNATEIPPDIKVEILERRSVDYRVERYECPASHACQQVFRYGSDVMLVNRDWSECKILPLCDSAGFPVLSDQIYYSWVVRRQMIQLHASIIDTLGRGVVFLGPSGIGKTTQAERWAEYRSASIINGDIVFVQQTEEGFLGWGTPWHGSSPYCLNASVPVKALVVLKQAPYNALRELTGFEKVSEVSGSVFYPTWLEDGMELCTATLDRLLTQVPVYRLDNRADEEAVALLERELDRIS